MTLVRTPDDLLTLLDGLLTGQDAGRWDALFADRATPRPFFVDLPDENLVRWFDTGRIGPGRVLELGCGNGRNAVFLARRGCAVDAVDFSAQALGWAREQAAAAGVEVAFHQRSIFDLDPGPGSYDLVYDGGCLHHVAPHRRPQYLELVRRALRPGGRFGLVCLRPGSGGGLTDREVYQRRTLGGGLGFSAEQLRALCGDDLTVEVLRPMTASTGSTFGEEFLTVLLATRAPG